LAFLPQLKPPQNVRWHPSNRGSVTDGDCQSDRDLGAEAQSARGQGRRRRV
jgi:hypothetical protein